MRSAYDAAVAVKRSDLTTELSFIRDKSSLFTNRLLETLIFFRASYGCAENKEIRPRKNFENNEITTRGVTCFASA